MIVLSITDSHNSQNYDNNNCKKKKKICRFCLCPIIIITPFLSSHVMKFNDLMTLHYFKNIYYKMAQMMFKVTP